MRARHASVALSTEARRLEEAFPKRFAGTWRDREDASFVVWSTVDADDVLRVAKLDARASYEHVCIVGDAKLSQQELEGLSERVVTASDDAGIPYVCRLQCSGGQVACDGTCIDPATDEDHCEASNYCEGNDVGTDCGTGESCLAGTCRRPDGETCNVGVDCISGICTSFFLDIDGDDYGAASSGMERVCGAQPPSADYVTNNLDCCDDATNVDHAAAANPDFEVPNWPSLSIPECAKPFDWDCDGVETPQSPLGGCAQHTSETACVGSYAGSPACGTVGEFHYCFWSSNTCQQGSIEGTMLSCY